MEYNKPEILLIQAAVRTIQGIPKPGGSAQDVPAGNWTATSNAYEADE